MTYANEKDKTCEGPDYHIRRSREGFLAAAEKVLDFLPVILQKRVYMQLPSHEKDEAQFAEESFTPQTLSEARELCAMSEELIDCALIVIQQARILVDQTRKLRAAQRHTRRGNDPSPPRGKSKVPFPMMRA